MAIKELAGPVPLLDPYVSSAVQSANFTSNVFNIQQFCNYAIQATVTTGGIINCSIAIQESVDGVTFVEVPSSARTFNISDSFIWNGSDRGAPYLRVAVTFSGGSATFSMYGFAKTQ